MLMSTSENPQSFEIEVAEDIYAVTFTANGEYLVGGGPNSVRVWQAKDGKQVATIKVKASATCVATSRDGRYIAAGMAAGDLDQVLVWDATNYDQVFAGSVGPLRGAAVFDVDFSLDSSRLVSANCTDNTATIWDLVAGQNVHTLDHSGHVVKAKYSPREDQVATATYQSVQVWDDNGRLLVDVKLGWQFLWCNNHLFALTLDRTIKQVNAATGSTISEWALASPDSFSFITLPQHGKFIACSTDKAVIFWDTATHSQLGSIRHPGSARSISSSPDGQLLAIAVYEKLIVKVTSVALPSTSELELNIDSITLDAWNYGQLNVAEALLSAAISKSENKHHELASRALVRTRLGHWDAALEDAKDSIKIQRSLVAYVAMCLALVGMGEEDEGIRVCDIAFQYFHSEHVTLLLVIKAVVLFVARKHADAISRMTHLITDVGVEPELCAVQAYMRFLLGNKYMESRDYERAIQSFEDARIILGDGTRRPPLIVLLISGWSFDDLVITVQQCLCEALLAKGHAKEAEERVVCIVDQQINVTEPIKTWVSDFKLRCRTQHEDLGDSAANSKQYDEAVLHYTAALSLDPIDVRDLLIKRSKAYAEKGKWGDALNDANEAIERDPFSPLGYERKYAALHCMGHRDNATNAFETMLSKMSESSDPAVRERSRRDILPEQTVEAIRASIQNAVRDSPLVLINTSSGRLCNKSEQATVFESTSIFVELVTSMTTLVDRARIEQVVGEFYRYATLSHTWEGNEPLYEKVMKIVVYDLEACPTHEKLQMFCKVVRDEGFIWAWSDTCCIDKGDHFVLQEALISMFKWYEGSAMTIIFLFDVDHLAELGALTKSRWNSRGWTFQEYHASKVVRIYTKGWTPYLGLTIYNHKNSPDIVSEMEKATGLSAQALMSLRPGLNDIRQKLCLASTRQTTRVEDAAYSLLGIFSTSLPVTYGEGDKALGRLLSQLLTSSGDSNILAWTGAPSSFNSCLPANIAVFSQPTASHIPPAIADTDMGAITTRLRASSLDLNLITRLYDQLNALPLPLFAIQRMKLLCIAFEIGIGTISSFRDGSETIFRVHAGALGVVNIKTDQDLTRMDSLYLVHPWIDFLLDRQPVKSTIETTPEENANHLRFPSPSASTASATDKQTRVNRVLARLRRPFGARLPKVDAQSSVTFESSTRAYEFLARLKQPFGALLLTSTRQNVAEYKRIATECLITVQVEELTSATLERLTRGVRVLDVL